MRSMHPMIIDCVHRLDQYLESKAKTGEEIEMKEVMGNLTMDVIASCAFGTQIDTYNEREKSPFVINASKVLGLSWRAIAGIILISINHKLIEYLKFKFMSPSVENFFTEAVSHMKVV